MAQKNVMEQSKGTELLTEHLTVELHFTKAMLETYKAIAKHEGVSLNHALNRTFFVTAQANIDSTFDIDDDHKARDKMQPLWAQVGRDQEQAWRELDAYYKERA